MWDLKSPINTATSDLDDGVLNIKSLFEVLAIFEFLIS